MSNSNVKLQFYLLLYKYSYTDLPAKAPTKKKIITNIFGMHMHTWN